MKSILVLSHQGFSFVEDLAAAASELGLTISVLSSQPAAAAIDRVAALEALCGWARVVQAPALSGADVARALEDLAAGGRRPSACVSVWEGYRSLMAEANYALGARDLAPERVRGVLDKLAMRRALRERGLTRVSSEPATREALAAARAAGGRKFVKPRRGLGSYGAFRLDASTDAGLLERLSREMAGDREYAGLFGGEGPEFILEDYIAGVELSFEMIAAAGRARTLAVHEKLELEEASGTTLENCCVSPPVGLAPAELDQGKRFVEECLGALGLDTGCFHVEARFDREGGRWEIIEINPRVGGALIKESVRVTTGGESLLRLWLESMLARDEKAAGELLERLSRVRQRETALFRVYFGEPGRRIGVIRFGSLEPAPAIARVAVRPGTWLPVASREIFLAQALWRLGGAGEAGKMLNRSRTALEVTYE